MEAIRGAAGAQAPAVLSSIAGLTNNDSGDDVGYVASAFWPTNVHGKTESSSSFG